MTHFEPKPLAHEDLVAIVADPECFRGPLASDADPRVGVWCPVLGLVADCDRSCVGAICRRAEAGEPLLPRGSR